MNNTSLIQAIEKGSLEEVKSLLESKITKSDGDSLLHVAAQHGQTEIVEFFLDNNHFDVNSQCKTKKGKQFFKTTPLMLAIDGNHSETVKLLLDRGASVNVPSLSEYQDCLINASVRGDREIIKLLLDHGIFVCPDGLGEEEKDNFHSCSFDIIKQMVRYGDRETIKLMLSYDYNDKSGILAETLSLMIVGDKVDTMEIVFKQAKEQLDEETWRRVMSSCFHPWCFFNNNLSMIKFLLENGAEISPPQGYLDLAIRNGRTDVMELLLANGADVNDVHWSRGSLLHFAIAEVQKEMVEFLLSRGADVNLKKKEEDSTFWHKSCPRKNKRVAFEISKIIVRHIVDLLGKGMNVSDDQLITIENNKKLRSFKIICEKEMELIKEQKFNDCTVSLYDVWKADSVQQLTGYLKNKEIADFITCREFSSNFTVYFEQMRKKFNKGFNRIYLQQRICNFFSSLSTRRHNRLPKLPAICVHQIINQLTNKDLSNLRQSYF